MDLFQQDFMHMVSSPDTATATAPNTPKKPKRKALTPEQKIAQLEAKQARLQEQVKNEKAKISAKNRKEDTRRKIVAGAIALEHMEYDENFKNVMEGLLKKHVKESDLHLFEI